MYIQTSRFGAVNLNQEDVLNFKEGILGFSDLHEFVLLDDPTDEIFAWLQSCEQPGIAFPVLEPELFMEGIYQPRLGNSDLIALRAKSIKNLRFFCIITIPDDPKQMTANIKAPVAINVKDRIARQCVLQDNHLAIREPIFSKLQQRAIQLPPLKLKSQAHTWGVAVRLPEQHL